MTWFDQLDSASEAYAIAASANHRIRVVAGPGTGKSFAMKRRVARLLEAGIDARRILPVTFTRVAAEDLHRELVGMGVENCDRLKGTTLHSLALRILMRNHVLGATGRVPRPLNEFEIKPLEADLADAHGGVKEVRKKIKAYEAAWARLQYDEPGFVLSPEDAAFARDLLLWLVFHRAMLIGEVIPQLHEYLRSNPGAAERTEYSHILVDEYQDLNRAEQRVIDMLADEAEICIVGDDDQSIYSFKHAHPEGIREWMLENPGADDLTLEECRRCPTRVVDMANALIGHNRVRPVPRTLRPYAPNGQGQVRIIQYATLDDEVTGVTNLVFDMIEEGAPPGDILVLAQRGAIGTPIYEALQANEIPVKSYYAESELSAQEAQERFSFLRLLVDREDRVALRWLLGLGSANWQCRGYRRLRGFADREGLSPWAALEEIESGRQSVTYTAPLVARFRILQAELDRLHTLREEENLIALVDDLFPDGDTAVRDIRALSIAVLDLEPESTAEQFLASLSDAISKPEVPSEVQEVRIMSLHKSKGLSSPITIIAGCIEGLLPKQPSADLPGPEQRAQLEEQRRLFYVGISRVKAVPTVHKPGVLILTYSSMMPLAAAKGSGIVPAQVSYGDAHLLASRFIHEMGQAAPQPQRA